MYLLLLCLLIIELVCGQEVCRTPNGNAGTCVLLDTCGPLKAINKITKKTKDDIDFLRQSSCGLHLNIKPKVCCPPPAEWSTFSTQKPLVFPTADRIGSVTSNSNHNRPPVIEFRPPPPNSGSTTVVYDIPETYGKCPPSVNAPDKDSLCCGREASSSDRIVGGRIANIDEFPWLALIEYDNAITSCGGTLISNRYVLTAGHCMGRTRNGYAQKVRLSEYDTRTYPTDIVETPGGGFEEVNVVIIPIVKEIPHPQFNRDENTPKNDIGLFKLAKNAPYTEFIRPICLPYEDITKTNTEETIRFIVAGWGSNGTTFNEIKQYVNVPYVPLDVCQLSYKTPRHEAILEDTQLCAGGEEGKDSCGGDSGGPLMYEIGYTYVVVGVVSFGTKICGQEGKPAVYTNVYQYLDWLQQNMV